jgi:hypothetical protein
MTGPKIQFSLLAMLLFVTMVALILGVLRLPSGHFALDSSFHRSVSGRDMAVRIAVITPLVVAEFAGILLILRMHRHRRRRS